MVPEPLPWEVAGLPCGLTPRHFALAADVAQTGRRQGVGPTRFGGDEMRPLKPGPGTYFHLYGAQHHHNQARLSQLAGVAPMFVTATGEQLHPVVLVTDPSGSDDVKAVGICAVTGYLGSVWNETTSPLAADVAKAFSRRQFFVTRLMLTLGPDGLRLTAWLPTTR